jgi:hypothetical protein
MDRLPGISLNAASITGLWPSFRMPGHRFQAGSGIYDKGFCKDFSISLCGSGFVKCGFASIQGIANGHIAKGMIQRNGILHAKGSLTLTGCPGPGKSADLLSGFGGDCFLLLPRRCWARGPTQIQEGRHSGCLHAGGKTGYSFSHLT